MEILTEYARLMELKKAKTAELNELKATLATAEAGVEEFLVQSGLQSLKLASGQVVYLNKAFYASAKDGNTQGLVVALEDAGFKDLVTVNHNTFKSFCKEQIEDYKAVHPEAAILPIEELEKALPQSLHGKVVLSEKVSVRMRKS